MGTERVLLPEDGECSTRSVDVAPFLMAPTTVTNAQFARFVADTGYQTEAERFGWSFVFWANMALDAPPTQAVAGAKWWRRVEGANWREINGPGTQDQAFHDDHPVVHVSWNDARTYAQWAGGRLPTEAEWEHAARGGLGAVTFPWGDKDPNDREFFPCNIWQGTFPVKNTLADGYAATAPAQSYAPNGYGLYNMVGNVWQWLEDPFRVPKPTGNMRSRMHSLPDAKLLKGGSFLCHRSYCYRYRIAARSGNSPDSTTTHQGFRMVWDVT